MKALTDQHEKDCIAHILQKEGLGLGKDPTFIAEVLQSKDAAAFIAKLHKNYAATGITKGIFRAREKLQLEAVLRERAYVVPTLFLEKILTTIYHQVLQKHQVVAQE